MAKHANEIIGFHLGWDMREVSEGIYQRHRNPSVYVCGDSYYCAPTAKQKLPNGFNWQKVGEYYGRTVFSAEPENVAPD